MNRPNGRKNDLIGSRLPTDHVCVCVCVCAVVTNFQSRGNLPPFHHTHASMRLISFMTTEYQYRQLPSSGWFRVLSMEPSVDLNATLHCTLQHSCITAPLDYDALSYTWENSSSVKSIILDSTRYWIKRSLYPALCSRSVRLCRPLHHQKMERELIC